MSVHHMAVGATRCHFFYACMRWSFALIKSKSAGYGSDLSGHVEGGTLTSQRREGGRPDPGQEGGLHEGGEYVWTPSRMVALSP